MYSLKTAPKKEPLRPETLSGQFYYLQNFHQVLDSVEALYEDILPPSSREFIEHFRHLPLDAQALLIRLHSRKGPIIREDKLSYPEIGDVAEAIRLLADVRWLQVNPPVTEDYLLATLTKAEISAGFGVPQHGLSRPAMLATLHVTPAEIYATFATRFLLLTCHEYLQPLLDAFFGSRDQDLSAFIVSELGHIRYPDYPLERRSRRFHSTGDLQEYADLEDTYSRYREWRADPEAPLEDLLELVPLIPAIARNRPWRYRCDRLINRIGRACERAGEVERALELYAMSELPPARERRVRLFAATHDWYSAYTLCLQMQEAPADYSERHFARFFMPRILKQLGLPAASRRPAPRIQRLEGGKPEDRPELRAMQALGTDNGDWHYVENWLFNAWLGLWFWDVIYSDAPGAFTHPFQIAPHDLYEPGFRQRREKLIRQRLAMLEEGSLSERQQVLLETWQAHEGKANPFVGWYEGGAALLEKAHAHIPARHIRVIAERWLSDLRNHRSGFPDLIQWRHDGGYELVEVKGPGDQLRPNQTAWLQFFGEEGIPARVVYVA